MVWVTLLAGFTYMASRDANIIDYATLQIKRGYGFFLGIKFAVQHPGSFWMKLLMRKNSDKDARILAKELGLDKNQDWND